MTRFSGSNIHIYHADIGDAGRIDLGSCWTVLSKAEKDRAERFHFDIHRNRYVRANGQLRAILSHYLGIPAGEIPIETERRGKPFVAGADCQFNMSHSADTAVFAVSDGGTVGIDVELFDRKVEIDDLSRHYYTASEQQALARLEEAEKHEMFFWLWTAKEARMKVTGEGLALDPRKIDVVIEKGRPSAYRLPATPETSLLPVVLDGLKGACCVAGLFIPRPEVRSLEGLYMRRD